MTDNGGRRSRYYRNKSSTGLSERGENSLGRTRGIKKLPVEYVDDLGNSRADSSQTVTSDRKSPMPVTVILMIVVCTVMLMMMVWSFVRINEYTIDIENLQDELDGLKSSRSSLTIQLEQKNNLQEIQDYAVNVLGMVKLDQLAKKYITVDKEDKIEVLDENRRIPAPETEPETEAPDQTSLADDTESAQETQPAAVTAAPAEIVTGAAEVASATEPPVNIAETEAQP